MKNEKKEHEPISGKYYCYCHQCVLKAQDYFLKYLDRLQDNQEKTNK